MNFTVARIMRPLAAFFALFAIVSCGILPSAGPNRSQILSGGVQEQGDAIIIPVTRAVIPVANFRDKLGFDSVFLRGGSVDTDVIRSGDVLELVVYENVEAGILGTAGVPSRVSNLQVDQSGSIFVPFAGRIKVSGRTTEAVRRDIVAQLAGQTPDPQVQLARLEGEGSSVTVIGTAAQGVYPISTATKHLTGVLARAGGAVTDPGSTIVTVQRSGRVGRVWLQDLYLDPKNDIHLRPGDRVIVTEDKRRFSLLGEFNTQGSAPFSKPQMSAIDAIALGSGLSSRSANPKGIFVLRNEDSRVTTAFTDIPSPDSKRVVYVFNLIEPNGLFLAREFMIRDGDTVYVTEAPYSQFTKIISLLLTPVTSVAGAQKSLSD